MKELNLYCTECSHKESINKNISRCPKCGEPMEVELIKKGKINYSKDKGQTILERYSDFFPYLDIHREDSLGEGFTSLVNLKELSNDLGLKELYLKNESQNPTWSFKDRGTLLGVLHAKKLGYKKIGTVSTGNMAPSVAAYAAKFKLDSYIFVDDLIAEEKLAPILIYNPRLFRVKGDYGSLYYKTLELGRAKNIYFINSDVPLRVEGSKTIAFEICEQLAFNMPDFVVVPTSAGGNIRGIEKGFREFKEAGIIDKIPKIICAQSAGCSPIDKAYRENKEKIERFENPATIAHAIENPLPPSGNQVLRMLKRNGGFAVSVHDDEILEAQRTLAQNGLFLQPASCVPLAAVIKLRKEEKLQRDVSVVLIGTGGGLKYTSVFEKYNFNYSKIELKDIENIE
ncbi:MAG: threonine synthase [Sulfurospirillaceae bacterium]|nr:threonine synthase [Sulfurospirillaceae bacterium]